MRHVIPLKGALKETYLSTNSQLFLKKRLAIAIQNVKSIYADINLDVTERDIFTSSSTEGLPQKYTILDIIHLNQTKTSI